MSRLKHSGLALTAALTLALPGAIIASAQAQTTTIEQRATSKDAELLPDMSPPTNATTETDVYHSETFIDENDLDGVDENDAEVAGISITTLLIFALLAFAVVAIVVALSRRERSAV